MVVAFVVDYVTFYFILEFRVAINQFILYQFIDLDKSLRPPPPQTTRPPRICAGSGVSIKSAPREGAEAHHGGDGSFISCVDVWVLVPT